MLVVKRKVNKRTFCTLGYLEGKRVREYLWGSPCHRGIWILPVTSVIAVDTLLFGSNGAYSKSHFLRVR